MSEEEKTEETTEEPCCEKETEEEEPWVGDKKEGYRVILGTKSIDVKPEDNFVDTIKGIADDEGVGKFKVIYDDKVILPADAPESFKDFDGHKIVLEVIDEAGY